MLLGNDLCLRWQVLACQLLPAQEQCTKATVSIRCARRGHVGAAQVMPLVAVQHGEESGNRFTSGRSETRTNMAEFISFLASTYKCTMHRSGWNACMLRATIQQTVVIQEYQHGVLRVSWVRLSSLWCSIACGKEPGGWRRRATRIAKSSHGAKRKSGCSGHRIHCVQGRVHRRGHMRPWEPALTIKCKRAMDSAASCCRRAVSRGECNHDQHGCICRRDRPRTIQSTAPPLSKQPSSELSHISMQQICLNTEIKSQLVSQLTLGERMQPCMFINPIRSNVPVSHP